MSLDKVTSGLAEQLITFMQKKFGFDRIPAISYVDDLDNYYNPLCKTGGYDQENETIQIFITGRHPKDILRSLAHEMLHHVQKCEGVMDGKDMGATVNPNYIMHDDFLKGIEADAFERGNITFREWEACQKGEKIMSESKKIEEKKKKMPKAKLKLAHKKAKKALKMGGFEQYGDRAKEVAYATMTKQAMGEREMDEVTYEKSGLDSPEKADLDKDDDINSYEEKRAKAIEASMDKQKLKEGKELQTATKTDAQINDALKNAHNYNTTTRALPETSAARDEFVFAELLKKFGIKK